MQAFWKTLRYYLDKLRTQIPYDPAIPLILIYKYIVEKFTHMHQDTYINAHRNIIFLLTKSWNNPIAQDPLNESRRVKYSYRGKVWEAKGEDNWVRLHGTFSSGVRIDSWEVEKKKPTLFMSKAYLYYNHILTDI